MRSRVPSVCIVVSPLVTLLLVCGQIGAQAVLSSPPLSEAKASQQQPSSAPQSIQSVQAEPAQQSQHKPGVAAKEKDDAEKNSNGEGSKWHVRLGTVTVGASYLSAPDGFLFNPFYPIGLYPYSLAYSGFYDPLYYSPFYYPYSTGFAYSEDKGKVELAADAKDAAVYLDGAYAGLAANLKRMWLQPGAYNLTVAAPDGSSFHQRIYVLSGKSLKIRAKLVPQNAPEKPEEKHP